MSQQKKDELFNMMFSALKNISLCTDAQASTYADSTIKKVKKELAENNQKAEK